MRDFLSNRTLYIVIALVLLCSLALVFLDGKSPTLQGWFAYSILLGIGVGLILATWRWIQTEDPPPALLTAAIVAIVIRILVGLILVRALPVYGYDQNAQKAGYVYFDAYKRDRDALALARSDLPLATSFTEPLGSDQYGGMVFVSAGLYRYLSPDNHRPLLVTILGSLVASIVIFLGWRFTRGLFGEKPAGFAIWLLALYPESVLVGASQMREPFIMTAFSAALLGYLVWKEGERRQAAFLLTTGIILIALPFSPPFALTILASIGFAWLWEGRSLNLSSGVIFGAGLGVVLIGVALAVRSWGQLEGMSGSMWQVLSTWWNNAGAQWRINLLSEQSLNLDILLDRMPGWIQLPFLIVFGVAQPFLPAAIVASGAPIWKVIGILRSLGWYLIIPFLLYAPIAAVREKSWRSLATYISIFVWFGALVASYRAPSYQWDNPRYRVSYILLQAALVGWLWIRTREASDRWVVKLGITITGPLLVITHWYLGRYYGTPSLGLTSSMILAIIIGVITFLYFLCRDVISSRGA